MVSLGREHLNSAVSPMVEAFWDYSKTVHLLPAATVMLMPNVTYSCAPTAFIEAVVAVPQFRRLGVAARILDRVLKDAEANGCDKVQIVSHKRHASDGGHDLYAKAGFTAEAEGFRLYLPTDGPR